MYLGQICQIFVLCVNILQVFAPCPFGHNPALPKQPGSEASFKPPEDGSEDGISEKIMVVRLKHLINITDTDKDGKSSVDELTTWNHEAAKERFVEEAKERLLDMDKNKDGKVSFEEYDKSQQKISRADDDQQAKRFRQADEDNSGFLTKDEIISMFHPEESPHMFDVVSEEFLQLGDENKDGLLSFDEYKRKVLKKDDGNQIVAKPFFNQQDKNQDGNICKEEIKAWLSSLNSATKARKEAENLIRDCDDNKDGAVSEEEVVNHVDIFMKATKQTNNTKKRKPKEEL